ncbi:MAG: tRNA (adenosine(37)-N6)-threonylcarbamoyltransferase complex transferase subunit TsaD [Candidatus Limnocylindrus sp.]|jgi:N6-L-threonylcarbamoyladenine synthase
MSAPRLILAIESSCDESAVALVRADGAVLAERVATQAALHATTGGVVPEAAARAHHAWLPRLLAEVVGEANGLGVEREIDAVAVTAGPGLLGSLLVGAGVAAGWAWGRGLPIVPTNHLEGHLRAAWLYPGIRSEAPVSVHGASGTRSAAPMLPAIGLVVSGGHTLLVRITRDGAIERLGGTVDDAAGEAFDKIARLIGLPYPGGAALSALAATAGAAATGGGDRLPIARTEHPFDFSFSGVKTAAVRMALVAIGADPTSPGRAGALAQLLSERPIPSSAAVAIAAAAERAIVGALVERVERALDATPDAALIVGGGVAANATLRRALATSAERRGRAITIPPIAWCTDNAAMIGAAAHAALAEGRVELHDPGSGIAVAASWQIGAEVPR